MKSYNNMSRVSKISLAEMKGKIVDMFEDYLEEKEYIIPPNEDKNMEIDFARESGEYDEDTTDEEIAESEGFAQIYGEDYDLIGDPVEDAIKNGASTEAIKEIYDGFNQITKRSGITISLDDEKILKSEIADILYKWRDE